MKTTTNKTPATRIEICRAPEWHGRNPARAFVAEAVTPKTVACGWGATPVAAAQAARLAARAKRGNRQEFMCPAATPETQAAWAAACALGGYGDPA
jgi:hypothetical protein